MRSNQHFHGIDKIIIGNQHSVWEGEPEHGQSLTIVLADSSGNYTELTLFSSGDKSISILSSDQNTVVQSDWPKAKPINLSH